MISHIAGIGCVTPLGCELDDIWRRIAAGERPALVEIANAETGAPHLAAPVPQDVLATLAPLNREPRLRRASQISLFATAAGKAALADSGLTLSVAEKSRLAVILGVSSGGVQYTRRFYEQVVKQGANAASPLLFPETVYNAPASHLAAMLGMDGATYTLVGDSTVGLQALQLGTQLIELGNADHVLVVAAEELDWILLEAHHEWHLLAKQRAIPHSVPSTGANLSEGAAAVFLSRSGGKAMVEVADCISYFHPREAAAALTQTLRVFESRQNPELMVEGANGTWIDAALAKGMDAVFEATRLPGVFTKDYFGESLGSSSLQQVVMAVDGLQRFGCDRALVSTIGWNEAVGAAWIERAAGMPRGTPGFPTTPPPRPHLGTWKRAR